MIRLCAALYSTVNVPVTVPTTRVGLYRHINATVSPLEHVTNAAGDTNDVVRERISVLARKGASDVVTGSFSVIRDDYLAVWQGCGLYPKVTQSCHVLGAGVINLNKARWQSLGGDPHIR